MLSIVVRLHVYRSDFRLGFDILFQSWIRRFVFKKKKRKSDGKKFFTSLVNVIWKWNIIPLLYTEADLHLLIFIERPQLCK